MNPLATSTESILAASRELIRENGWNAVSIRAVAARCDVSPGTIYNYYESKAELLGATVESIWQEIFFHPQDEQVFQDAERCVGWIYQRMEYGNSQFPGFFSLHSLSFMGQGKRSGKERMMKTWEHILHGLTLMLQTDPKIRADAFDDRFPPEQFAEILFPLILVAIIRQDYDPAPVLALIERTVY